MREIVVIPTLLNEEKEDTIRPTRLDDFIGQKSLKESLKIIIESSKKRVEPLDHILLSGPPGLGKTTLARIIANEMSVDIKTTSGPVLEKPIELTTILAGLKKGDILFIDEIHRLRHIIEEILYPAMEDFYIDMIIGEGSKTKSIRFDLEHFTLIGATTKTGLLTSPFRDRFGLTARLNLYEIDDLVKIIYRNASIFGIPITEEGALEIARCSRGTPRVVNRLLKRVRDFAIVKNVREITQDIANNALTVLGIDKLGLDELDRRILTIIDKDFKGGPVGVKTIGISVGEDVRTIEDVYEPFLIHIGFIKRTSQGREVTDAARKHLGFEQDSIFIDGRKWTAIKT